VRDTNADWEAIAATEPYFGVLANERFLKANLDAGGREEFFASGRSDVDFVLKMVPGRNGCALDFGCGVARLSLALASHFDEVTGVDVSETMLAEARANAGRMGAGNVRFTNAIPMDKSFDLVLSHIVFQHIPPQRGLAILNDLLSRVGAGGRAAIQMTFYRKMARLQEMPRDFSLASYDGAICKPRMPTGRSDVGMSMYDYDATDVLAVFFENGFDQLSMSRTDHGGHIGAWVFARRS
jgi:SAM-dependent methyltransferase